MDSVARRLAGTHTRDQALPGTTPYPAGDGKRIRAEFGWFGWLALEIEIAIYILRKPQCTSIVCRSNPATCLEVIDFMERETGFEPATSSLGTSRMDVSTTT